MPSPRHRPPSRRRPRSSFELLEARRVFDAAGGVLAGADLHLTLSFAPDGTSILGQTSGLAAKLNALGPTAAWQETILRAFQTWAKETNADVGVVLDGGQAFGVGGATQRDPRFGDIRIGAVAMEPNVGAVNVPTDTPVGGTWFADVLFNMAFNFTSLDDLYAVALNEAGNVFGLKDHRGPTADPDSPLTTSNPPVVHSPTAADLADLHALLGTRSPDANEKSVIGGTTTPDNNSFSNATPLKRGEASELSSGSLPTVVYGDLTIAGDVDFFTIRTPGGYSGGMTVTVRTRGISLLAPQLDVYDENEQLVGTAVATDVGGGVAEYQIPSVARGKDYYFKVSAATPGPYAQGGYSLAIVFDGLNIADPAFIAQVAGGAYRFLPAEEIAKLFDPSDDDLFNDDLHGDDVLAGSTELTTVPGFVEDSRYQIVGSIADSTDVDFYGVKSPPASTGLSVLTATVRSLDAGGLIPKVRLIDKHGQEIPAQILANGGGDVIIQATGLEAEADFFVQVSADDPHGLFNTGNYELTVAYGHNATPLSSLAAGTVGGAIGLQTHTLYVAKPQLFHLALQADAVAGSPQTVLIATIYDAAHHAVHRLSTIPGETRSAQAAWLSPGTYTVEVAALALNGPVLSSIPYSLLATSLTDTFVGDPNDPTANPFACPDPNLAGFYCYPGNIISPDPFLWNDFVNSLPDPPTNVDLPTLVKDLIGSWWTWYWGTTGDNGPPLAQNDTYHAAAEGSLAALGTSALSSNAALTVGSVLGVLNNDIDPEGSHVVTILNSNPTHGTLDFGTDGGFVYTPTPGFAGLDQFTYRAYDFMQESNVSTVKIVVGVSADFDASAGIDGSDFLSWQRGFGLTDVATLVDGDSNFDGAVDAADLATWRQQYAPAATPVMAPADANSDGQVDGVDFLAWQRGYGATSGATVASGDFAVDGAVNGADLAVWTASFGAGAPAVAAASVAITPVMTPLVVAAVVSTPAAALPIAAVPTALLSPAQLSQLAAAPAGSIDDGRPADCGDSDDAGNEPRWGAQTPRREPDHSLFGSQATAEPRRDSVPRDRHDAHSRDEAFADWCSGSISAGRRARRGLPNLS